MKRLPALLLGIAMLVAAVGCGYHLVGTSTYLPPELKTLYVAPFENRTDWSDLDQRITEAVSQEWVRRRRYELVDQAKGADMILRGIVTSVSVAPVTFDEQGRATEYQMTMTAATGLYDNRGSEPKLLWEDKAFSRRTSYTVDVSTANYFDRQYEAMDELSADFARALVSAVLEGF